MENATQVVEQRTASPYSDGFPPGMSKADAALIGKVGYVHFSGNFYALGGKYTEFSRRVQVIYALKTILVLQDKQRKNLYIIDREKNFSLGCHMNAHVQVEGRMV